MDHAALTSLRQHLPTLHASSDPKNSSALHRARLAANSLSDTEVLREVRRLPPGPDRVLAISALGAHPPLSSLRRATLADISLTFPPEKSKKKKAKRHRTPRGHAGGTANVNAPALSRLEARHAQAISSLVREWHPLTGDDPIATRALNALSAAYPVVDQEPIERQPPSYVDSFQSEFDSLSEKFAALGRDLSDAMSVIGDGDVRDHDGLVEFVSATWASVRARRVDIGDLRARMSAFIENSQHPQRDRLTVGELVHQIDERVRSLHQRKTELRERGFTVREVSLGLEGDDDSSSEGEWEDAVDISVEKTNATEEDILPEVTDWAKVMRGEEGQDTNRLILESLERRSADTERSKRSAENSMGGMGIDQAEIARGRGPGSSRVRGRGRGRGHGRGAGRGRRQLTARERISKKLGLKKIKKKSLLDDL